MRKQPLNTQKVVENNYYHAELFSLCLCASWWLFFLNRGWARMSTDLFDKMIESKMIFFVLLVPLRG
jgi:hypothetical protein